VTEHAEMPAADKSRLHLRGVTKSFGGRVVVDIDDLRLGHHGIEGIIGPNGAGKTTLMNIITKARRPNTGLVTYHPDDGAKIDLTELSVDEIARRGVVKSNQVIQMFGELTTMDSMLLALAPADMEQMYRPASLRSERRLRTDTHAEISWYLDYFSIADPDTPALSAGDKKLVDIIRCLLLKPRLLLLDEPTAGLPEDQTRLVMDLMRRKVEEDGMSIVIVEHDLALIWEVCEFVHFMADGKVAEQGPPEQIRASATVAAKYLGDDDV
jgi:ABC-type branched-subunit amino acid transport system ATPase component